MLTSLRDTLEYLEESKDLLVIDESVDPYLEIAGITKAIDNSYAVVFNNVSGFPGYRVCAGLFSRSERVSHIFAIDDVKDLKTAAIERIRHPVPPEIMTAAPCQEIVETTGIDVLKVLPVTHHTPDDPGRILSGGVVLITAPGFGKCISYKRINFRGADWASLMCVLGSHADAILKTYSPQGKRLPLTINISPSPAVLAVAGGGLIQSGIPLGSDELAIAGGLQRSPVGICRAVSVDAYSIADAEFVVEGYLDTAETIWESEEAEQKKDFSTPFFPEYHGYLGRAQTTFRFQVTAITRRKDSPIYYAPLAHSFESPRMQVLTNRAFQWEVLHAKWPDIIRDINSLNGMKGRFGLVIQVTKRSRSDDGIIRDIISATLELATAIRMVIVVDEDIDIYNAEEVIWALCTRMDAGKDLTLMPPAKPTTVIRQETVGPFAPVSRTGFDATIPFEHRWRYYRGRYPKVNLRKWLTPGQVQRVRGRQSDYAKLLALKAV